MIIYEVLLYASRMPAVLKPISIVVVITSTEGSCGSKDYSIILSHSRVLRADSASSASGLSKIAFRCCLDFYIGLW